METLFKSSQFIPEKTVRRQNRCRSSRSTKFEDKFIIQDFRIFLCRPLTVVIPQNNVPLSSGVISYFRLTFSTEESGLVSRGNQSFCYLTLPEGRRDRWTSVSHPWSCPRGCFNSRLGLCLLSERFKSS